MLLQLFLLNAVIWFFIHMGISAAVRWIPLSFFERTAHWYRALPFEKNGQFYQERFHIRLWKDLLPDGTKIVDKGFDKSRLKETDAQALYQFLLETMRAESTHWLLIPPAALFFLWNPAWAGWVMVVYALVVNLPFIMIQRFNRPRFERVYQRVSKMNPTNKRSLV